MILFGEAVVNVIQIDPVSAGVLGTGIGGAILGAAKIVASALTTYLSQTRQDIQDARQENRTLTQTVITLQAEQVKTLVGMQAEVRRLADDSKMHKPV